jgi:hypothetical protein
LRLNQVGDGGVAGGRLQPEQHASMEEPGRRTRHRVERRSDVALVDWQRSIPALSLGSVRWRFLVSVALD